MKVRLVDPADDHRPSRAELERTAGLEAMRMRRQSIYRDWRPEVVPTITLQQATWLLLGLDPNNLELSSAEYRRLRKRRHREVLSRIEYAVGAHKLKPVGKPVQGTARRFRLAEVAAVAIQLGSAIENAEEILNVIQDPSTRRQHYRVADARKRWDIHRAFVASLSEKIVLIPSKAIVSGRRIAKPKTLDVSLSVTSAGYRQELRKFCERKMPELRCLLTSDAVIDQDRRDLNVRVRMGRPPRSR